MLATEAVLNRLALSSELLMTLHRKELIERSRDIQQRSRDLRKQTETIFADTKHFVEKARRLAFIIHNMSYKNARAIKKAAVAASEI